VFEAAAQPIQSSTRSGCFYAILLKSPALHLVYKHAISTLDPPHDFKLPPELEPKPEPAPESKKQRRSVLPPARPRQRGL